MSALAVGQEVAVNSHGHRQDGRSGTVAYIGQFLGTIGVEIDGSNYGFFASELTEATK